MTSIAQHYSSHLAPVYVWMAGGIEAAIAVGTQERENSKGLPIRVAEIDLIQFRSHLPVQRILLSAWETRSPIWKVLSKWCS